MLAEFTGERVIPGQVNDDLWNEHMARYAFAHRYAAGKRILDAGCGAGYGSAHLAPSALSVTGVDLAPEAVAFARANYSALNLQFFAASCHAMPFPAHAFDLVVAFEVIEHLPDHQAFLHECARVLGRQGLFIVSSPNKRYYAESRARAGPNPYHEHEFEPDEFVNELTRVFANVRLLLQNRVESFAFHPAMGVSPADACITDAAGAAEDAHFLIGLCSSGPLPDTRSFIYVPKAANLLREREQHIELLEQELSGAKQWLADTQAERDNLLNLFHKQKEELEERNRWAAQLNEKLDAAGKRIAELQKEAEALVAGYEAKIHQLEQEGRATAEWATRTSQELEAKCRELAECVRLLDTAEATVAERTRWAQFAEAQLSLVQASRWVKLGRKLGLGPVLKQP